MSTLGGETIYPWIHALKWKSREDFLCYTSGTDKNLIQANKPPPRSIMTKWRGIITSNLKLKWGNIWDETHTRKEGAFIWSNWQVVALNSWKAKFIANIDEKCIMCETNIPKTVTHRFWECMVARSAWEFSNNVVDNMKARLGQKERWRPLDWQHGIFKKKIPKTLGKLSRIWLMLRGITI